MPKGKVTTIPNGIELPASIEESDSQEIECISIGRIEKEKGIHYAIRAIANLSPEQRNSVVLNIVGEGAYLEALKRLVEQLSIGRLVVFHGRIDDDALSDIYQKAISTSCQLPDRKVCHNNFGRYGIRLDNYCIGYWWNIWRNKSQ